MATPSRPFSALAGAVAGLVGVAVSQLLTSLLNSRATPVEVVAEAVIAVTPGPVAEFLISVVGRADKPILMVVVLLVVLGLSAVAGVVADRRWILAQLIFLGMGALALVAAMARPGFTPTSLVPLVAGVGTWVLTLSVLMRVVPTTGSRWASEPGEGSSRRGFLLRVGVVGALSLGFVAAGRYLGGDLRAVETTRRLLRLPVGRGSAPADADLGVRGTTPWRVRNENFYRIDTAIVVPVVDPAEWRLRIHGMVEKELILSYTDLVDRELTEAWVTLCCVSNPVGGDLIGNAFWSGVRVADLLAEAGVRDGADAVLQTSADGWTCGTPLVAMTDDRDALLAVGMNGEPLPVQHGFPVRMVVPGLYGYVSATKWVVDLEVTRFSDFTAYWTDRGWSARGPVKTHSRIEVPRGGDAVRAGSVRVGGQAWAQHTGVAKVEYRLDGGSWISAELGGVPGDDTWVQWAASLDVAPGDHSLAVRATDRSGYTQTSARADVVPDGATGWHTVEFSAG